MSEPIQLSNRETEVVRHALGLTRKKEAYRNLFTSSVNGEER